MGTDIHMRVQVQSPSFDGGSYWRTIDPPAWWPRDEWGSKYIAEKRARFDATPDASNLRSLLYSLGQWYSGRNYNLFALLADVRNGSGFAGVLTGDGWPSIAPSRGLPNGVEIEDDEYAWLGDHSHTWMTVAELLAFNWNGTATRLCGVVSLDSYVPNVQPKAWSGDVWGHNCVTVEENAVDGLVVAEGTRVHVRQWWTRTAAEAAGFFHSDLLPAFERLAAEHNVSTEQVRLVMGFDS